MARTYSQSLVSGETASAAEVQAMFDDAKGWVEEIDAAGGGSPTDSTYRTIFAMPGTAQPTMTANTYIAQAGSGMVASGSLTAHSVILFYFDDADYTLTGETPVLRTRAQVLTNATAPAITFTFGLHAVTAIAGGANTFAWTVNTTPVTGSTVAFASPSASTRNQGVSSSFAVPADGYYVWGVTASGSQAANSIGHFSAQLQVQVAD